MGGIKFSSHDLMIFIPLVVIYLFLIIFPIYKFISYRRKEKNGIKISEKKKELIGASLGGAIVLLILPFLIYVIEELGGFTAIILSIGIFGLIFIFIGIPFPLVICIFILLLYFMLLY